MGRQAARGRAATVVVGGALLAIACGRGQHPATIAGSVPAASAAPAAGVVPASYRVSLAIPAARPIVAPAELSTRVRALAKGFDGRVGVAVRSVDQGWMIEQGGTQRLPQQSVSKLWVAMTVLSFLDAGRLKLDDPITLTREDLTLFHQPIAALIKGEGYRTTVGELLQRALTMSDNTANDRLLRYVGGPSAVRTFIAAHNLGEIRFGPGERLLQSQTAGLDWKPEYAFGSAFTRARARLPKSERLAAFQRYVADPIDGAAPAAIAGALAKLKRGDLLGATSTQYLLSTMQSSHTGRQRLRGAVPPGWTFGHKTGTGQDLGAHTAGYNDVGILTAPDGKSYTLAVMIGDTPRPIAERQKLMQAVVSAVVASHDG